MFGKYIGRVPTGALNFNTDPVIGMAVAPSVTGLSQFPGQLGKVIELDDTMAAQLSNAAVGTLFAGVYQYVQFANDATFKRGNVCFWDQTVAANLFRVTVTEANAGAAGAVNVAGTIIHPNTTVAGAITGLQFGWIQILGRVQQLFRAVLTAAGATQSPVYAAAAGAGADNATADVIATGANPTFTQTGLMMERFIGNAETAPGGGLLSIVQLANKPWHLSA